VVRLQAEDVHVVVVGVVVGQALLGGGHVLPGALVGRGEAPAPALVVAGRGGDGREGGPGAGDREPVLHAAGVVQVGLHRQGDGAEVGVVAKDEHDDVQAGVVQPG
ncbi:hypothetical protein EG870_16235, partial [Enterococcus faecalis]